MKQLFKVFIMIGISGCGFTNMFPSQARDQWYMEHVKETNFVEDIKIGMTKEQVLAVAGEPRYRRAEDVLHNPIDEWVYTFQNFSGKSFVRFKNGKVTFIRSH